MFCRRIILASSLGDILKGRILHVETRSVNFSEMMEQIRYNHHIDCYKCPDSCNTKPVINIMSGLESNIITHIMQRKYLISPPQERFVNIQETDRIYLVSAFINPELWKKIHTPDQILLDDGNVNSLAIWMSFDIRCLELEIKELA